MGSAQRRTRSTKTRRNALKYRLNTLVSLYAPPPGPSRAGSQATLSALLSGVKGKIATLLSTASSRDTFIPLCAPVSEVALAISPDHVSVPDETALESLSPLYPEVGSKHLARYETDTISIAARETPREPLIFYTDKRVEDAWVAVMNNTSRTRHTRAVRV